MTQEKAGGAGGYTNNYGYDGAGNRTTANGVTTGYNSANQSMGNTYDKAGNPTTYKGQTLTFDAENRLTSYGGPVLTNGFRGDSLRAWKQNSSGRTYFLYSGSQLVCEFSSAGTTTATNTVGPAGLISRRTSSGSVFYAFDTHGSVCQRLSSAGAVLSTQTFDAYGNRLSTDSNTDPYAGYQGANGYYTDWETGTASSALALLTFRYYDPSAGRFLTRDPIGYRGGANPYEYVGDGPTNSSDPLGTEPFEFWGAMAACAGILDALIPQQSGDPCNDEYNSCIQIGQCLGELLATAIKLIASAYVGTILAGCAEGLASGLAHVAAEIICHDYIKSCEPLSSPGCMFSGAFVDTVIGCLDGLAGNYFEKQKQGVKMLIDMAIEYVLSFFGMKIELSC